MVNALANAPPGVMNLNNHIPFNLFSRRNETAFDDFDRENCLLILPFRTGKHVFGTHTESKQIIYLHVT